MNVLITGAAGFIGSHLVDRCLRDGHTVVGVDNLLTGNAANLSSATDTGRFRLIEADVSGSWDGIDRSLRDVRPEVILHFASPASPVDYDRHPIETLRVNSIGTQQCLEAACTFGARFLFASTSEVYGDPKEHPQRENYWGNVNPNGPRSCYDEGKRYGEAVVAAYARMRGIDVRVVRIFNTYGPRMRAGDGRVIEAFIAEASAGRPLRIYGDGSQTRSFCYVDDLVEGIMRCAMWERAAGRTINLGNPQECTILQLAGLVAGIVGVPLQTRTYEARTDDPRSRCPDISVARDVLEWEPVVSLEDGLRRTIQATRSAAIRSTAASADATT